MGYVNKKYPAQNKWESVFRQIVWNLLAFGSSEQVEQMSQWTQRPAMNIFWDSFWDIRVVTVVSDGNYIANIFIYIILSPGRNYTIFYGKKEMALYRNTSSPF